MKTNQDIKFYEVPHWMFIKVLSTQQTLSSKLAKATTPAADIVLTGKAYLCKTGANGFAIQDDGEIVALFNFLYEQAESTRQAAEQMRTNK